jgi:hypothetical protein
MRFRSAKTAKRYVQRRILVTELLEEFPTCQRCNRNPSTEVHEVRSRARSGSILDRENCRCLCHDCHSWITEHPKAAQEQGWLLPSWPTSNVKVAGDSE